MTSTFAIGKDVFSCEKTFVTEEKRGKNTIFYVFSTTHSHDDNLQGFIAKGTKD